MLANIAWIPIFGIIVFVHELGHFLAAKWAGVYAPRFSIGFGPALWRRRFGETEYVLSILPLGGFVRMASREDETMALIEGGTETAPEVPTTGGNAAGVAVDDHAGARHSRDWDPNGIYPFGPNPVPEDRWFESKPLYKRLVIMFAGVTMNFILAFVVLTGMALGYGEPYVATRVVSRIETPPGAPALPLIAGDTISAVNGRPVANWNEILDAARAKSAPSVTFTTQRGPVVLTTASDAARDSALQRLDYYLPPRIGALLPGKPAIRSGLRVGDRVVAVDGAPVSTFYDITSRIVAGPGHTFQLDVLRDGKAAQVSVRADSVPARDPSAPAPIIGQIGASPEDTIGYRAIGLGEGIRIGALSTAFRTRQVFDVIKGLFSGRVALAELGGPIGIARGSAAAARSGLETLLNLLALLSVNIAIFNLLPIPILDGGQVVLLVAESIKGRPFTLRTREWALRAGLAFIGLVFVTATWNDITRWISERVH